MLLVLPFVAGCGATRSSAVRPSSVGTEKQIVLTRQPRAVVEVSEAVFEAGMVLLAAEVHAPPRPFEGRLLFASWQPQDGIERELAGGFRRWCGWKQSSAAMSGCESILEGDGRWLRLDTREAMAFSIAMSSVWDGAVEAVRGMVDPAAFQAMVYTSLATCMALLVLPEPTSKALVVAITVGLCTYLGWSTVWGILQGWKRMSAEAKAAQTFEELSAAGERFGKLLGANTARVMVMVATMALGSAGGTVWRAAGPKLPAWGQAARLATAEGLAPALAAPAGWVMVVGEELTIGLAVGANVAMAATTSPSATPGASYAPPTEDKFGDLTPEEIRQIQKVVDEAGRPLEVVGSAARGTRRGIGTELPVGKGNGTRSDIDYLIPHSSIEHFKGLENRLPSVDPKGPIYGTQNPYMGPAIRFEPGTKPRFIPERQP